jgi:hypothetical protein
MISFPGRTGRRRRVMNEEVLSASTTHTALRARVVEQEKSPEAPRYSDAAGVENHPQITDFIPRRYRSLAVLTLSGALTVAALSTLHYFAIPISTAVRWTHTALFDFAAPGSLASWVASVVLFFGAVTCLLIYSLRRHRVDDYRGRYRVWLAASVACLVMSANSVVGLHGLLAETLTHFSGRSALRDGAAWWLVLAGLPLAWIAVRVFLDASECRLAALLLCGAFCGYAAGLAGFVGGLPVSSDPQSAALATGAGTLLGHWLLLAAVLSYARFVVLDAQGLIEHRPASAAIRPTHSERREQLAAVVSPRLDATPPQPARSPATTEWVDGRRAERQRYDDDTDDDSSEGDRKLSKAERKQLRKLKARDRAA